MVLSPYHKKYANLFNAEIQNRVNEKRRELVIIFEKVQLKTSGDTVRVAVLGCGDKRFVKAYKGIFEDLLKKSAEIITFDIVIDHLAGEENVFQHDCTLPLPNSPFDITYAHVLLKFIEIEKQWDLIKNSYDALNPGGLAIYIIDKEDYETKAVPLDKWKTKLNELGVEHKEIPIKYGLALVILKE
jgi:SAM-dependent methyltransferase